MSVLTVSIALQAAPLPAQTLGDDSTAPGDATLSVPSQDVSGDGTLSGALTLEYTSEPYEVLTPSLENDVIVSQRTRLELGVGFALRHRWLLAANIPVVLSQSGEASAPDSTVERAATGFALGDANLLARAFVWGTPDHHLGFSVQGRLWIPTGSAEAYTTDERVRAAVSALFGGLGRRHGWTLELGGQTRREQIIEGVVPYRIGHELGFGAAARFALDYPASFFGGTELRVHSALSNGARLLDPRSTRGHWLVTGSWRPLGTPLTLTIAVGPGVGEAPGAAGWQGLMRVAWAPLQAPPPPDWDEDGVPDAVDACRQLAGVPSSDPLMHGCPDLPRDADGDAIPDAVDACPIQGGPPSSEPKRHGCPKARRAPASPRAPSPESPGAELAAERIIIHQQIQFETGTAALRPESAAPLAEVARILREHPELELIEVQGHTDEVGTKEFNQRLSLDRARAVVAWLVERGIAAERLKARGFGSDRPLAGNQSEQGRQANRRVEFHVLGRSQTPGDAREEGP